MPPSRHPLEEGHHLVMPQDHRKRPEGPPVIQGRGGHRATGERSPRKRNRSAARPLGRIRGTVAESSRTRAMTATTTGKPKRMQDLKLIGVHEDGDHLLADGGGRYRLALDDALRYRRRPSGPAAPGQCRSRSRGLRPRDVQSLIPLGAPAPRSPPLRLDRREVRRFEDRSSPSASSSRTRHARRCSPTTGSRRRPSASGWRRACATGVAADQVQWDSSGSTPASGS